MNLKRLYENTDKTPKDDSRRDPVDHQRLVSGIRSWWVTADEFGTTGKECVTIVVITQVMLIPFYVVLTIMIR